jgi:nuclear pore complex protein Nup133
MASSNAVEGGGPATATRSRRRQRPKSSESLNQQPKAKRQRLPLTEQTFVNPDVPQEMAEVKDDKVAKLGSRTNGIENSNRQQHNQIQFAVRRESSGRPKKPKHGDRATNKGDGSLLLVRPRAWTTPC